MGIASMVIGIIAAICGFVPFCGYFALLPALTGFVLGIVDVTQKKKAEKPCGQGIAGIVLNSLAILTTILWTLLFAASAAADAAAGGSGL
jgi:hypothetical protein